MKNVIYTMIAVLVLTFPHFSFGEDYQHISPEVSAILISSEPYGNIVSKIIYTRNNTIKVSKLNLLSIPIILPLLAFLMENKITPIELSLKKVEEEYENPLSFFINYSFTANEENLLKIQWDLKQLMEKYMTEESE